MTWAWHQCNSRNQAVESKRPQEQVQPISFSAWARMIPLVVVVQSLRLKWLYRILLCYLHVASHLVWQTRPLTTCPIHESNLESLCTSIWKYVYSQTFFGPRYPFLVAQHATLANSVPCTCTRTSHVRATFLSYSQQCSVHSLLCHWTVPH